MTTTTLEENERTFFNWQTHNGAITIDRGDGTHLTFRIETVRNGSLAGKRILSLLIGPDEWKGFAFVTEKDVFMWRRFADDPQFVRYRRMIVDADQYPEYAYMYAGRCRVCNRELTTPDSIRNGIGPVCAAKGAEA